MSMNFENVVFELNTRTRDTVFFIFDTEDGLEYAVDCSFDSKEFYGQQIAPSLCINPILTNAVNKEELVGKSFSVENIEQADEREDTFYVFEHEPLEKYQLTILDIDNDRAHIECTGIAVIDGYSEPYKTGKFEIKCWLPIITNVSDWDKFGL
ncbi:hypothetical protein [Isobaculum melis]|uniref:Uncharacterized protein n=1 Tax=Isobaculum melis TaxID=142588 RepID=A0A1H9T3T1_9LACT|nr:hypothetical protein [Isobaculum melis]SER91717.1 hypothetical protein SAMN04488559_110101 [Isobaculum melis]